MMVSWIINGWWCMCKNQLAYIYISLNGNDPRPTATTWKVMSGWVRSFPIPKHTWDSRKVTKVRKEAGKKRNRFESDSFENSPNLSMIRVPRLRIQSLQFVGQCEPLIISPGNVANVGSFYQGAWTAAPVKWSINTSWRGFRKWFFSFLGFILSFAVYMCSGFFWSSPKHWPKTTLRATR